MKYWLETDDLHVPIVWIFLTSVWPENKVGCSNLYNTLLLLLLLLMLVNVLASGEEHLIYSTKKKIKKSYHLAARREEEAARPVFPFFHTLRFLSFSFSSLSLCSSPFLSPLPFLSIFTLSFSFKSSRPEYWENGRKGKNRIEWKKKT